MKSGGEKGENLKEKESKRKEKKYINLKRKINAKGQK
jgi:hypothetical protein